MCGGPAVGSAPMCMNNVNNNRVHEHLNNVNNNRVLEHLTTLRVELNTKLTLPPIPNVYVLYSWCVVGIVTCRVGVDRDGRWTYERFHKSFISVVLVVGRNGVCAWITKATSKLNSVGQAGQFTSTLGNYTFVFL